MLPHVNPDLQGSLSSPAQRGQPALLPGSGWPPCGPGADIYLRTTGHYAQAPSEITLPGVVVAPSPSSSSGLSSAESNIGLCGVCRGAGNVIMQGTPCPRLAAYSGPSPRMLQALLVRSPSCSQLPRAPSSKEVSGFRDMN